MGLAAFHGSPGSWGSLPQEGIPLRRASIFVRHFVTGKVGTILSGLMTIGVTMPSRTEAAGAGWASPPPGVHIVLCTILYIPG